MDPLALFLSASGRITRRPFWLGVLVVYVASFISQSLLDQPMVARAGLWPFVFAQAVLIWSWYALHAKRLRDGGVGAGGAAGAAILYALAILLMLLTLWVAIGFRPEATQNESTGGTLIGFLFVLYLIGALTGSIDFGSLWWLVALLVFITLLPFLVGAGMTLYAGTRPAKA